MEKMILFISLSSLLLASCTKQDTSPAFVDKPIVEAYLKAGDTLSIKVSRQLPFSTSNATISTDDIDKLGIDIVSDGMRIRLTPQGKGVYKAINPTIIVTERKRYDLKFIFNKDSVTATTVVPAKPVAFSSSVYQLSYKGFSVTSMTPPTFPDPVKLKWTNADKTNYIVVVENIASSKVIINDFGGQGPTADQFRLKPTQDNSTEVNPLQFVYYGMHRVILYHLNPDYASLYDDSGSNSINLTNPATKIKNGLGIFTGMNSDTLFINIKKP